MKIRERLTIRFSIIVLFLLCAFSAAIYLTAAGHRESQFYQALKADAISEGRLYSKDVKEIDTTLLRIINKNSINILNRDVFVYSDSGKAGYQYPLHTAIPALPADLIRKIKTDGTIEMKNGRKQGMWVYYKGKSENLIIYIYGNDISGYDELDFLLVVLCIGCLCALFVTYILGYFYSKQTLSPINAIINSVRDISASSLDLRLPVSKNNDEIDNLSSTFNQMLNRLEESFEMKKDFISSASHELRTPLGILMVQIEVALLNERTPEEYKKILHSLLEDIKRLRLLMNGLLELTEANMNSESLKLYPIRIDEMLWQAKSDLMSQHPDYNVIERYSLIPENQKNLIVMGNDLLSSALINIMSNGCKYSHNNTVYISLEAKNDVVILTCTDMGIGITENDLKKVFQPFFRGENAKSYSGNGLGLAITKKIIELHNGTLDIETKLDEYTRVIIVLPIRHG